MTATTPHLTQFTIRAPSPGYWRVTFDNPPINLMNATTAAELQAIVTAVEDADDLRVVVFDSANPDFFFARYDLSGGALPTTPGPTGLPPFLDTTVRLSQVPVISIAEIRGRARGGGNEFALACDMRFAAAETALFGQPEIGSSLIPGGGGIERLAAFVGRGRALEIVLSADDFDAATAERYGWINRALPGAELTGYVDALSRRIATFDSVALGTAKTMINRHTLPAPEDLLESLGTTETLVQNPAFLDRFQRVSAYARATGADFDVRMGHHMGAVPDTEAAQ
ncbi:enoyl-CoA hydratase/isomerase family protein [Streptomyces sp. NPDC058614]|uniref:enoyl-CoA hydratase/isomerase family protein n=1 Tax=Streptomyces sp. NPDC058614 TaxID=3346557 RepID=UPI0036516809